MVNRTIYNAPGRSINIYPDAYPTTHRGIKFYFVDDGAETIIVPYANQEKFDAPHTIINGIPVYTTRDTDTPNFKLLPDGYDIYIITEKYAKKALKFCDDDDPILHKLYLLSHKVYHKGDGKHVGYRGLVSIFDYGKSL